ncbi:helix-turn-helix domain-containing protein [Marinobacterium aestuariivivens]|uniref:Helix-turn-helix domain-containing protein n=1 Tax=Marinobacterium aestuariivivens TaxID=1698799 RepID=A0ABW2A4H6_9GAMM
MPYLELRKVGDGRKVCYAPHSHTHCSLGAITEGKSTFLYRDDRYEVSAGTLVLMNPDWVHACNPIDNQPWAYLMLYVDTDWLTQLRYEAGLLDTPRWQNIANAVIPDASWYEGYVQMADCLLDPQRDLLDKQTEAVAYLSALMHELAGKSVRSLPKTPKMLQAVANYLDEHATEEVSLDTLCDRSGYSPGHLIRAFRQHFGLTPHAYQINRRIQFGQQELKDGKPIVEVALNAGFNDQPHFQRTFKRLVAATPNQYRKSLVEQ